MFVGIDVSKERLDVAVRPTGGTWQEPYDPDGIISLAGYVRELMPHLVVADATGDKELVLAGELATARLSVEVVNPRHVRDFARASGKLAKTVAQDAQVLAHFAEAMIPEPRTQALSNRGRW